MPESKGRPLKSLRIIAVGILINLVGVYLAKRFGWPLFLDSIGTILAAALGGLLPGILVGFASNAVNSIADPITLYYGLLSVLIALVAYCAARRGAFKKYWSALLCVLPFAFIGGVLGSLMTWLLYGFDFGTGISAGLANYLHSAAGYSKFWAQFMADLGIDLMDKLVSVNIVYLLLTLPPKRALEFFRCRELLPIAEQKPQRPVRSLRVKVSLLISATAAILSILAVSISFLVYKNAVDRRYVSVGEDATRLMAELLPGDRIDDFLAQGEDAPGYRQVEDSLRMVQRSFSEVQFVYVYQIREDGCHVVFDMDTEDVPGTDPGEVVDFDESFRDVLPALLAGEEIAPVVSNDSYGWLLTVYKPVRDSDGRCAAYAAVDIAMEDVVADRYIFVIRMISLLFGASICLTAFAVNYSQTRMVDPIDALAHAASHFAFDSVEERNKNAQTVNDLKLQTGDEIENLYNALKKTITDMSSYVDQLAESTSTIAKLQENIIVSLAEMVESRDECTGSHIRRTSKYVQAIGEELIREGCYPGKLDRNRLAEYERSAPLHDIGKIKVPDSILNKPGKLTEEEFARIKTHTTIGRELLQETMTGIESAGYLCDAMEMAACHHERWDGGGYPEGLRGEEIPLGARLMALADVTDALLSKRSYKEPFDFEAAVAIIENGSGTQFDPTVVEAFMNIRERIREISRQ